MKGLLLLAHGARDAGWAAPFEAVAASVRERAPEARVALAFLEFMPPDLLEAGRQLADAGCDAIDVVPLFLGTGGHVRQDVPTLIARLARERPRASVNLRAAIGEHPRVIEAMARAVVEGACG